MAYPLARGALAAATATLVLATPSSALPPAGGVLFVDQPAAPLLDGANSSSVNIGGGRNMSEDGRYVVFSSSSDALERSSHTLVFRRDLMTGETILVSTGPNGPAAASCGNATLSADGTKAAFFCSPGANIVSGADVQAAYVRDISAGTTDAVSRGDGAGGAVSSGGAPVISGDGTAVAFITNAALPAVGNPTDSNGTADVYVRDGTATHLASVAAGGNQAVGGLFPAIDHDGTSVAWVTSATVTHTNAAITEHAGTPDVYLHERTSGDTYLISHGATDQAGVPSFTPPALSGSGNLVGWSTVTGIVGADDNGVEDVYNTTVSTDVVSLVSRRSAADGGAVGNGPSNTPAFPTGSGSLHEAFLTFATNLGADGNGGARDVAVRSFAGPTTRLATGTEGGGAAPDTDVAAPSVSGDGTRVVFSSAADNLGGPPDFFNVFARTGAETTLVSRPTGTDAFIGANPSSDARRHALSADGRYVVFESSSDSLSSEDDDRFNNIFRLDTQTGALTLVTVGTGGPADEDSSALSSISADGTKVAFTSAATNLVPDDVNGSPDVFVRDLSAGTTILVSRTTAGEVTDHASTNSVISADGNRVAFVTSDQLDPVADGNANADVYVRDVSAGTTQLVSRADGAGGAPHDGTITGIPDIDADGSRVVFATTGGNLSDGDANGVADVHLRDLRAGTTTWISVPASGLSNEGGGENGAISGDGTVVAFDSASTTILAGDANGARDVFVRDLGTGATTLVSAGPGGAAGDGASSGATLSRNGRRVAFTSGAENLAGTANGLQDAFLRDVSGAAAVRIMSEGPAGPGDGVASIADLDATGNCVLIRSASTVFAPSLVDTTDFSHLYLRALEKDCPVKGAGPGPGPGAGDHKAPVIRNLRLSKRRVRVRRGVLIRFKLSEKAATTLRIERARPGRRKGKRCVKPRRSLKRHCTRWARVGTLRRPKTHKGANKVKFSGRFGGKPLKRGSYRVVARARDAAGNTSKPRRVRFKVVRR